MTNLIVNGFLSVYVEKKAVRVTYTGNMGHTMDKVAARFDELFGQGKFHQVRKNKYKESGSPDYYYSLVITKPYWNKIVITE